MKSLKNKLICESGVVCKTVPELETILMALELYYKNGGKEAFGWPSVSSKEKDICKKLYKEFYDQAKNVDEPDYFKTDGFGNGNIDEIRN